jgi:hypothetical protein
MDNPIERARLRLARQDDEMFMPPGLPYFLSLEVVDYAEEMAKQIAILKQQAVDSDAARLRDAEFDRANLAEIARLERENVWLRRQFWIVTIVTVCVITGLSIALWSAYHVS